MNDKIKAPQVDAAHPSFPTEQRPAVKPITKAYPDTTVGPAPTAYTVNYAKDFPFQQNHVVSASRLTAQVENSMKLKGKKADDTAKAEEDAYEAENFHEAGDVRPRLIRTWIWEGFLPSGEVTLVTGPGGCGKTSMMMKLAGAIWRHEETFGGFKLDPGAAPLVMVTVGEQSEAQLQELALMAGAGEETEEGFRPFYHQVMDGALGKSDFWNSMRKARGKWPHSLFLVDSATSALRCQTDSADSVRETYGLLREVGGAWAVLHHNNKDKDVKAGSVDKVRGSSAWIDGCDRLLMVTPELGAAKLAGSRRGDPACTEIDLPWQRNKPEDAAAKPIGRPATAQGKVHAWMDDNVDFCIEVTGEEAWKRFEEEDGGASRTAFMRARGNWQSQKAETVQEEPPED